MPLSGSDAAYTLSPSFAHGKPLFFWSAFEPQSSDTTPAHLDYCRAPHVCNMQPHLILLKTYCGGFNTRHYNETIAKVF